MVLEDVKTKINGITVTDADDFGIGKYDITLSVEHGKLTSGSTTGASITFTGISLADLQNKLNSLQYQTDPNFNGTDQLEIKVKDNSGFGKDNVETINEEVTGTFDILIRPVNDKPELTLPGGKETGALTEIPVTTGEYQFGGDEVNKDADAIVISDVDVVDAANENKPEHQLNPDQEMTVTITVKPEKEDNSYAGEVKFLGNATDHGVTVVDGVITGTLAEINAFLADGVVFKAGNLDGKVVFSVTVNDGANGGTALTDSSLPVGNQQGSGAAAEVTKSLIFMPTNKNDAPDFEGFKDKETYNQNTKQPVQLQDEGIKDEELDLFDNWKGATLTIEQEAGTPAGDFGFNSSVTTDGNNIKVGGKTVATINANADGELEITFTDGATAADADTVFKSITYKNDAANAPREIELTYTLADGNTNTDDNNKPVGSGQDQGAGGQLSVTNTMTVTIDRPVKIDLDTNDGKHTVHESALNGGSGSVVGGVTKVNGIFTVSIPDGLHESEAIKVHDKWLTKTQILELNANDKKQVIETDKGQITLTGYTADGNGNITINYTYDLLAAQTHPDATSADEITDIISITAKDIDSTAKTADIKVTIVDDVPEAVADKDENTIVEDEILTTSGNVLTNDIAGADTVQVTGVAATNIGSVVTGNVNSSVTGTYGSITIAADGSYTYTLNNDAANVQALKHNEEVEDIFTYTITDADGDQSTTTITITITGTNDAPVIEEQDKPNRETPVTPENPLDPNDPIYPVSEDAPNNAAGYAFLNEADLPGTAKFEGKIEADDVDGDTLTYSLEKPADGNIKSGGEDVSWELVGDTLTGKADGKEVITIKLNQTTGEYTVTLLGSVDHPAEGTDLLGLAVGVKVNDGSGQSNATDSSSIFITIQDDVPVAEDDVNNIDAGKYDPVTGNVITADDGSNGNDAADRVGADGAIVTAITSKNTTSNSSTDNSTGVITFQGEYGTLTINPDGSYSYQRDTDKTAGGKNDVFAYTITDGDGDTSTATLTIEIENAKPEFTDGSGNKVTTVTNPNSVKESGLVNGSEPKQEDRTTTGTINYTSGDGTKTVTIKDKDGNEVALTKPVDPANKQAIEVENGTVTITKYEPENGIIEYEYELTSPVTGADGSDQETVSFDVTVTDLDGDEAKLTVEITVVDDAPQAEDDRNTVTEGGNTATPNTKAEGNVIGGSNKSNDDVEDTVGADGAEVTGVQHGTIGADTHLPDTDNVDGSTKIDGTYGYLTINKDGSYTYTLDNSRLETQGLIDGQTETDIFTYTITDGDGDQATATLTIDVKGTNDTVSLDVPQKPSTPADKVEPNDPSNGTNGTKPSADRTTADHIVFESGLDGGSNSGDKDSIKVENSFTIDALDGLDDDAITLVYTDRNGDNQTETISKGDLVGLNGSNKEIQTQYGRLVLKGYELVDDVDDPNHGKIIINYTYTLEKTATHDSDNDFVTDSISIKATDRAGVGADGKDHAEATLEIIIVDDKPVAEDDYDYAISVGGAPSSLATGNLITGVDHTKYDSIAENNNFSAETNQDPNDNDGIKDIQGADDNLTVISVKGKTEQSVDNVNEPVEIEGAFGTLTIYANGDYIYTPDYTNPTVSALNGLMPPLADTFTYTVEDADGDQSSADLKIEIFGAPSIIDAEDGGEEGGTKYDTTVYEAGLSSNANAQGSSGSSAGGNDYPAVTDGSFTLLLKEEKFLYNGADNSKSALKITANGVSNDFNKAAVTGASEANPLTIEGEYGTLVIKGYTSNNGVEKLDYTYTLTSNAPHTNDAEVFDSFEICSHDQDGVPSNATLNIRIVDDKPTAQDDTNQVTAAIDSNVLTEVTGNVINTGGGKDTVGADNAKVTAIKHGSITGEHLADTNNIDGTTQIDGKYGYITINADGSYKYTLDNSREATKALTAPVPEVFTYTITDGDGDQDTATLTITVTGVNNTPVVTDQNKPSDPVADGAPDKTGGYSFVTENNLGSEVPGKIDVKDYDQDDTLTVTLGNTGLPNDLTSNGSTVTTWELSDENKTLIGKTADGKPVITVTIEDDGSYSVTLNAPIDHANSDPNTPDLIGFEIPVTITDSQNAAATTTIFVTIEDSVPVANNDAGEVKAGETLKVSAINGLLSNDKSGGDGWFPDGGVVKVGDTTVSSEGITVEGIYGKLTIKPDGSYSYESYPAKPGAEPQVTDTFTYTVRDKDGDEATAKLIITVENNQPPVATPDTNTVPEDTQTTGNLLNNDTDPDNDLLKVTDFTIGGKTYTPGQTAVIPGVGSISINENGSYTFTPVPDWNGEVPIIGYGITDGKGGTDSSTLKITVTPAKDITNDTAATPEGTPVKIPVLNNDKFSNPDAKVTEVSKPGNGTVVINPDGTVTYTPKPGFSGKDSFTYTVTSGGVTETATVTVTVTVEVDYVPAPPAPIVPPVDTGSNSPLYDPTGGSDKSPLTGSAVITDPSVFHEGERWDDVRRLPIPLHPVLYVNNEVSNSQGLREQADHRAEGQVDLATVYEPDSSSLARGLGQDHNLFVSHAIRSSQGYSSILEDRVNSRLGRTNLSGDDLLASPELRQADPEQMVTAELFEQQQPTWISQPQLAEGDSEETVQELDEHLLAEAQVAGAAPSFTEQLRGGGKRLPMAARDKTFLTN